MEEEYVTRILSEWTSSGETNDERLASIMNEKIEVVQGLGEPELKRILTFIESDPRGGWWKYGEFHDDPNGISKEVNKNIKNILERKQSSRGDRPTDTTISSIYHALTAKDPPSAGRMIHDDWCKIILFYEGNGEISSIPEKRHKQFVPYDCPVVTLPQEEKNKDLLWLDAVKQDGGQRSKRSRVKRSRKTRSKRSKRLKRSKRSRVKRSRTKRSRVKRTKRLRRNTRRR